MRERPILFNGRMVNAIEEDRKTVTRRPVKGIPSFQHMGKDIMDWPLSDICEEDGKWWLDIQTDVDDNSHTEIKCPYGQSGDKLWVKETFAECSKNGGHFVYRADSDAPGTCHIGKWRPSIHMPRKASRITLEITSVRVERVQDITEADAKAEGCPNSFQSSRGVMWCGVARQEFLQSWELIYPGSWDRNDWVWRIEFREIKK